MKILSLFDGMSCGNVALQKAGIPVTQYFASEIDKYALQIAHKNHPHIIQLGDVRAVRYMAQAGAFGKVDFLIGGSPCQGFSFAGKQLAFDDPRSALFFEYVWALEALRSDNPDIKFMLENVRMKKDHLAIISQMLGVEPMCINSALLSAQNRVRFYWFNWHVEQPEDRGIYLRDIIESGVVDKEKSYCIDAHYYKGGSLKNYTEKKRRQIVGNLTTPEAGIRSDESRLQVAEINMIGISEQSKRRILKNVKTGNEKANCLQTSNSRNPAGNGATNIQFDDSLTYRKLTPIECERLMNLPDNYTEGVSNTQRYKMLGNGWETETIAHILRGALS